MGQSPIQFSLPKDELNNNDKNFVCISCSKILSDDIKTKECPFCSTTDVMCCCKKYSICRHMKCRCCRLNVE